MVIKIKDDYSNGIKLVYEQRENSTSTSINIFVKVGSIYEDKDTKGFSHFLEHMVFKGSKKYPTSKQISTKFDAIGAYFNAYTDYDHTCYLVKCDSDYLELILDILGDMLINSKIEKSEFDKEKTVVVDEIIRARDNVEGFILEKINGLLYEGSSFEDPIGSYEKNILNYDINIGKKYYNHFYNSSNMVISICSNLKYDKIVDILNKNILTLHHDETFDKTKVVPNYQLSKNVRKIGILSKDDLEQIYIAIGFKNYGRNHEDYYSLYLLRIILAGNMSSLLFTNLREKNGLTYSINVDFSCYHKLGAFTILTGVDKDKFINHGDEKGALEVIIDTLNYIKQKKITLEDLDIAKGFLKGQLSLVQDDNGNISEYNGKNVLFETDNIGKTYSNIYNDRYKNITLKDINNVIDKYIKKSNLVSYYIGQGLEKNTQLVDKIIEIENNLI